MTVVLFIHPAFAHLYSMNKKKFELPVASEWLTKKSQIDDKTNLVFFEPTTKAPRIVLSLYRSTFEYPLGKMTEFKKRFDQSKGKFLKKTESKILSHLVYENSDEKMRFTYDFSFENDKGKFREMAIFQQCKQDSYNFKVMIPSDSKLDDVVMNFFKNGDICPVD